MLYNYQASPRKGHIEKIYHIFAFLNKNPKLTLYFDPREPLIDPSWVQGDSVEEFKDQNRDAEDQLPPSQMCPETRGGPISTTVYVDVYHKANKVTSHGHTGFIILLNRATIIWYNKRHNTVETSTFSSDFIADKSCVEHITALCFKLRMLGIPVMDSAKILCDNESVVKNSFILSSTLS